MGLLLCPAFREPTFRNATFESFYANVCQRENVFDCIRLHSTQSLSKHHMCRPPKRHQFVWWLLTHSQTQRPTRPSCRKVSNAGRGLLVSSKSFQNNVLQTPGALTRRGRLFGRWLVELGSVGEGAFLGFRSLESRRKRKEKTGSSSTKQLREQHNNIGEVMFFEIATENKHLLPHLLVEFPY